MAFKLTLVSAIHWDHNYVKIPIFPFYFRSIVFNTTGYYQYI